MLGSSPVMAFLATSDTARAKAFFQDVVQLKLVSEEPFVLVFDAHGTMLRISKVREVLVAPYTVLGWKVSDMAKAQSDLLARGVTFVRLEGFGQDQDGVVTFPDGTKVAWFKDPDGQTLSLTQFAS